jgi:hypothetical protein
MHSLSFKPFGHQDSSLEQKLSYSPFNAVVKACWLKDNFIDASSIHLIDVFIAHVIKQLHMLNATEFIVVKFIAIEEKFRELLLDHQHRNLDDGFVLTDLSIKELKHSMPNIGQQSKSITVILSIHLAKYR